MRRDKYSRVKDRVNPLIGVSGNGRQVFRHLLMERDVICDDNDDNKDAAAKRKDEGHCRFSCYSLSFKEVSLRRQ